jgi:hypothetical protein
VACAYVAAHPRTALLAPLAALEVVFDRAAAAALLAALPAALRSGGGGAHARLAAPASVLVDSWEPTALAASLAGAALLDACASALRHMRMADAPACAAAGIQLPCLLKPRAACGAPGAHAMALLLSPRGGGSAAGVALPALAQAFIPHAGAFHKVYVLGHAVFASRRRSLPPPPACADAAAAEALPFDALAALPSAWASSEPASEPAPAPPPDAGPPLCLAAATAAAAWLRGATGLSLFGFDVVVHATAGDHHIVDLNYFPSCSATPGATDALAALLIAVAREHEGAHACAGGAEA